jgi:type I restriction enzyme M protein
VTPYSDLVTRLWRLCSLLRKDGVTYPQYVTELTYLIFLKLASERHAENQAIPEGHRWSDLLGSGDDAILDRYRQTLALLGISRHSRTMQAVFAGAVTVVRDPATLRRLVDAIDSSDWFSDERDAFGDAYEGLLQKNAEETKRGAGQYFTPRVLVDSIVALLKPRPGEIVQDPAAGTGGFLIAADRALRAGWRGSEEALTFQRTHALRGVENVLDTYRLLCMNLYLHGIESEHVLMGDTLSQLGASPEFQNTDVILSNPPFGPSGGASSREDLSITAKSASFQLPFVEHCMRALAPGGRAAVIVPDNVLFEGGKGKALRQALMQDFNLHTILRLPTGIFYAQGVRTNVLFFSRPTAPPDGSATEAVWIYDLRAAETGNSGSGGDFASGLDAFGLAFGDDPLGRSPREEDGSNGRFRRFSRQQITERDDDLYIVWLNDEENENEALETASPDEVAAVVERHLVSALGEIRSLIDELGDDNAAWDAPE